MLGKIGRCLLTLVLAFAFAVSPYSLAIKYGSLRVSETENAHAVAFLAPAGIAAAGMGAEECLAAFAAIGAVTCGWSLKDYVGAAVDDIGQWTDEQISKGLESLEDWTKVYNQDPEFWEDFDKMIQTEGGNGGNNGGGKDPKDFDNNAAWRALALLNGASLSVSALGFFADGIKNLMSANGSLVEIADYPNVSFVYDDKTFVAPVVPFDSLSSFNFSNAPDFWKPLSDNYTYLRISSDGSSYAFFKGSSFSGDVVVTDYASGYRVGLPLSSSSRLGFMQSTGTVFSNSYTSDTVYLFFYPDSSGDFVFGESAVSPEIALLLDKAYTNTTFLDNMHEIADAPQAITGLDVDSIKQYLNQIASNASTGTYTYVKPTTTTVRTTYTENLQESTTKPDKVTDSGTVDPKPDEPDEPEGFDWNKFLQPDLYLVFPFCLPWDLYSALAMLNADPVTPKATLPLTTPVGDFEVDLDLKDFDGVARVLRTVELLACAVGLIFLTKKMINL